MASKVIESAGHDLSQAVLTAAGSTKGLGLGYSPTQKKVPPPPKKKGWAWARAEVRSFPVWSVRSLGNFGSKQFTTEVGVLILKTFQPPLKLSKFTKSAEVLPKFI